MMRYNAYWGFALQCNDLFWNKIDLLIIVIKILLSLKFSFSLVLSLNVYIYCVLSTVCLIYIIINSRFFVKKSYLVVSDKITRQK